MKLNVEMKSTDALLRLQRGPLSPLDRQAIEQELAKRCPPRPAADSKEQLGLFEQ